MKQTIEQAVASVQNAPGSMYTREDVISLLNRIETTTAGGLVIDKQIIKDLCDVISDAIKDNARNLETNDVCDTSSAEFELYGNEIQLSSVDIDTDQIADNAVNGLYDTIEEFFDNLQEENETLEVPES